MAGPRTTWRCPEMAAEAGIALPQAEAEPGGFAKLKPRRYKLDQYGR